MTSADIRRIIVSGAFVVGAFYFLPTMTNGCLHDELLESLGVHRRAPPTPACTLTASGVECPVSFEHCFPSAVDELTMLAGIIAACLLAGASASRGSMPSPARGAAAAGIGAAIAIGIESQRFSMPSITSSLAVVVVSALLGLAGGYAAKRWSDNASRP